VFLFRRKLRSSSVRRIDIGGGVGGGVGIGAGGGFVIDCRVDSLSMLLILLVLVLLLSFLECNGLRDTFVN